MSCGSGVSLSCVAPVRDTPPGWHQCGVVTRANQGVPRAQIQDFGTLDAHKRQALLEAEQLLISCSEIGQWLQSQ